MISCEHMDTKLVAVALASLLIGSSAGYTVADLKETSQPAANTVHESGMHGEMAGMMAALAGKTGDAFDQAFLSEMIIHHEGAVEMAKAAQASAKHEALKRMAEEIISVQTAEIEQMKRWQNEWYGQN